MSLRLRGKYGVELIVNSHMQEIEPKGFHFEIAGAGTIITAENAVILLKYIVESMAEADRQENISF